MLDIDIDIDVDVDVEVDVRHTPRCRFYTQM